MRSIEYARAVKDEPQTELLASDFAECIVKGMTVSLNATLGAGKTRFVQAFTKACGVPEGSVVSPTYVICQEHAGDALRIHHLDVYRLTNEEEFLELGSEELFTTDSVKMIEWGDQVADCLPDDRVDLKIAVTGETTRTFLFRSTGPESAAVIQAMHRHDPQEIYKIVSTALWEKAADEGSFQGASIDLEDGFIHFSAAHQVHDTARKHFAGQSNLKLVAVASADLGSALRWESSRDGDLFPHLYDSLPIAKAKSVVELDQGLSQLRGA